MTPNDAQIDLLLRAYSRKTGLSATDADGAGGRSSTHLDADELSAFADGALPPATSARYVSHLADCDDCRKVATQLTLAAKSTSPMQVEHAGEISGQVSLWQKLREMFAVPNLRYAAFALVVIGAVGITFVALRRQSENSLVTQRTSAPSSEDAAGKPAPNADAPGAPLGAEQTASRPSATVDGSEKAKSSDSRAEPPPPAKEMDLAKDAPVASKRPESEVAEVKPSYAPPPPGERGEAIARADRDSKVGEAAAQAPPQPKKGDDEFRVSDRARAEENARGQQMNIDQNRARKGGPSRNETQNRANIANQQAQSTPSRDARNISAQTQDQSRTQGLIVNSESPTQQERKAGGRTFRRQGGGAWIDKKFKPSMSATDIKRGSEEFRALDSGLQSIAGQLGGEIVVVWKGKAYRIH